MPETLNRTLYTGGTVPVPPSRQVPESQEGSGIHWGPDLVPRGDILSFDYITIAAKTPVPGGFVLSRALVAEVEATPDGWVIRSGWVNEEAYGSTYGEAYTDFLTSLRDRYQSLNRRQERLSAQDRAVFDTLRALLEPESEANDRAA